MPIDASIYDNIKPVQIETPQQYQLNQNATQLALADQQQKLQAARETGIARSVLARLGNDPNAALGELRRVAPTYAVGYEKQLNESRKAGIENKKLENEVHKGRMDYALQMLDVADAQRDTDPQRAEAAYQLFRHNAAMDDEDAQALPPTLPSAEIVGHMKQLGMTAKEQMDQRDKALTHYANGDPQRGFAASLLSAATDPESWKEAQQAAVQMGVPRALVASFGDAPTPEALARAKDLSLTQQEREAIRRDDMTAANQATDNARQAAALSETIRNHKAMENNAAARLAFEKQGGVAGVNAAAGAVGPAPGNAATPDVQPGQKNDAYLQTLDGPTQALVKALAEGRKSFPSGAALRSSYWQGILGAVAKYDPTFDEVNYNSRSKTRADFTSGKSAQQINALNTVIGHLNNLSDAADALHNGNFTLWNKITNAIGAGTGQPNVTNFNVVRKAVADELTRVWRQAGGSEADIQENLRNLDTANSPAQLHGAIAQFGDLLESKLGSLNEQYRQGMGTDKVDILTPTSRSTLTKLEQRAGKAPTAPGGSVTVQAPNGKTYIFKSQADADAFKAKAGIQ